MKPAKIRTVKMQGGLGNQLFCLGFAHSLAALTGEPVALDVASYRADRYGHHFDLAPLAEQLDLPLTRRPLLSSRAMTAVMRRIATGPYVGDGVARADTEARRRGRYFNGYWQDEAYLSDAFRQIARAFLLERAGAGPAPGVVIHCRTYKEEVRPERRAVPDRAWFRRCLHRLEDVGDIALISDDPTLALQRIGDVGRVIRPVTGGTAWTDMALMLRARALILTNSTFSWWGGYCGTAGTILYPPKDGLFHYAAPAARFTVVA
jgi:hypothetical protein